MLKRVIHKPSTPVSGICFRRIPLFSVFLSILVFFPVFLSTGWAAAGSRPVVFVSILPQKYFVEKIAKEMVEVEVMVKPGANPAVYEPGPRQMAALGKASIYFAIGVPFEGAWLPRFSGAAPRMRVVHADRGIEKIPMASYREALEGDEGHGEHHDGRHGHNHGSGVMDPHIWLSPSLVKRQAIIIRDALVKEDPENAEEYRKNCARFIDEIDRLDKRIQGIFKGLENRKFMVFHPSWGYFARDYNLNQIPVEIEGKSPKPAQLQKLIAYAKREGIRVVFVQPQFSTKSAEVVAREIGGSVVYADPLALDWADNLEKSANLFKKGAAGGK